MQKPTPMATQRPHTDCYSALQYHRNSPIIPAKGCTSRLVPITISRSAWARSVRRRLWKRAGRASPKNVMSVPNKQSKHTHSQHKSLWILGLQVGVGIAHMQGKPRHNSAGEIDTSSGFMHHWHNAKCWLFSTQAKLATDRPGRLRCLCQAGLAG